jgi:hypothetical protein
VISLLNVLGSGVMFIILGSGLIVVTSIRNKGIKKRKRV